MPTIQNKPNIMKKLSFFSLIVCLMFASTSYAQSSKSLFNGKNLKGWETYVGPKEKGGDPIGLNTDPMNLFSVVELDDEKVIRISGEINASLATKKEYENYHLTVDVKWGDEVFTKRNSGLLYHSYGEFGVGLGVWMSSHELQLLTGNMGASYRMGSSYCEIPMKKNTDGKFAYAKEADLTPSIPKESTQYAINKTDSEKPIGEWNTVELYCFGTTAVHVVNGHIYMVNYNSAKYLGDGKTEPLSKGKIQFQSEGGELFLRNIKLKPLKELPAELLK